MKLHGAPVNCSSNRLVAQRKLGSKVSKACTIESLQSFHETSNNVIEIFLISYLIKQCFHDLKHVTS